MINSPHEDRLNSSISEFEDNFSIKWYKLVVISKLILDEGI